MNNNEQDTIDGLTPKELKELIALAEEPSDKDVVSFDEYVQATARWRGGK